MIPLTLLRKPLVMRSSGGASISPGSLEESGSTTGAKTALTLPPPMRSSTADTTDSMGFSLRHASTPSASSPKQPSSLASLAAFPRASGCSAHGDNPEPDIRMAL